MKRAHRKSIRLGPQQPLPKLKLLARTWGCLRNVLGASPGVRFWRRGKLLAHCGAQPAPNTSEPEPAIALPGEVTGKKKVLIVDDDAVIRQTTSAKLARAGYQVFTAADCSEAIATVGQERPEAIVLDLGFPADVAGGGRISWDGFSLMHWLRGLENSRSARFIVITGSESLESEKRARAGGATDFFRKPIDHGLLLQVLQKELTQSASQEPGNFEI